MGDEDAKVVKASLDMEYVSTEDSTMPDAKDYTSEQDSALAQQSSTIQYAGDGVVLPDGTACPSNVYGSVDATGLSNANNYSGHQVSSIDQAAPPANYGGEDTSGMPDGNKFGSGQDPSMEQAPQLAAYVVAESTVNYDSNKYMEEQDAATNQAPAPAPVTDYGTTESVCIPDENQYNSVEQHVDENGTIATVDEKEAHQAQYEDLPVISTEEERLWSIVKANSADFTAWTSLIQETEKIAEDYLPKIRKVYDAFLAEFPLCYGYWKKYADHEARSGSAEKIIEVYERAVQAVTYSVDIWLHYVIFAMSTYEDPDIIRRLFERGLAYVGTDYLSYPLWDKYIEFEYSQQEWNRLAQIYTRILQIPIQQLDRYFSSFKELAASRPLSELRTVDENAAAAEAAALLAGTEGDEKAADGENETQKPESAVLSEADELEKYIAVREAMYNTSKEMDAKIHDFETAIRRPYFHVKPLDDLQLGNWHRYLDFIEKTNDFDRIVKLYERCLIACANYPEYWIRYVQCMEEAGSMEVANDALARATQIFVKRQPDIHIFAAQFKEQMVDIDGARAEYQLLSNELAPGLIDTVIRYANMEHRLGNSEAAYLVFEMAIATEKAKEQSQSLPVLFIQYSRYLQLVEGNADRAREVLTEALQHLPYSKPLLEVAIHLESARTGAKEIKHLDSFVERMLAPKPDGSYELTAADREEISSIFLEFVDLFGDVQAIKKAEHRHRQTFLHKHTAESRKRPAQDSLQSDKTKVVKNYTTVPAAASPAHAAATAYPNGQLQWGAGYAQQPQNWQQPPAQQASQVQPQQWMPGYGQQGAYASYGGYANYGPSQQPANPAQQQAYGGYGQGYPPQAYTQQSYAQPAPAYSAPQQQAAAPQYYPGYY